MSKTSEEKIEAKIANSLVRFINQVGKINEWKLWDEKDDSFCHLNMSDLFIHVNARKDPINVARTLRNSNIKLVLGKHRRQPIWLVAKANFPGGDSLLHLGKIIAGDGAYGSSFLAPYWTAKCAGDLEAFFRVHDNYCRIWEKPPVFNLPPRN